MPQPLLARSHRSARVIDLASGRCLFKRWFTLVLLLVALLFTCFFIGLGSLVARH